MKKKYQAVKADVGSYKGITHEGKEYRFKKNGTFVFEDEGLAKELDFMYGKKGTQKLAISPYDDHETREPGHRYKFGALTSQKARDNYDRIFRKTEQKRIRRRKRAEVNNGL